MLTELTLKFYWPKYLVKYLNVNYGKKLKIDDHRYAFRLLIGTKKPNFSNSPKLKPDLSLQALYKIDVPEYFIKNYNISYISTVGSVHFINFIEGQFWEEMKIYVNSQTELKAKIAGQINIKRSNITGLTITAALKDFLQKFNINEEDMKFETILKRLQRKNCTKKMSVDNTFTYITP